MKTLEQIVSEIQNAKTIVICGKESSGKSNAMKEIVRDLSIKDKILVFSNHRDIHYVVFKPENVDFVYKSKDCTKVELPENTEKYQYVIIDEYCDNIQDILENNKNSTIFVKSISNSEEINSLLNTFELCVETNKNEQGYIEYPNTYSR